MNSAVRDDAGEMLHDGSTLAEMIARGLLTPVRVQIIPFTAGLDFAASHGQGDLDAAALGFRTGDLEPRLAFEDDDQPLASLLDDDLLFASARLPDETDSFSPEERRPTTSADGSLSGFENCSPGALTIVGDIEAGFATISLDGQHVPTLPTDI